ncbi:MAG: bifunctional glutamate N-acetyltransferase/amino-acid acetyltransferase ArgJ [Thermodesulfovibrionales bacterium]|nr:bifunctional glutamate N-acetyltransferase/amino-acid acetyltransferase ArgJ [Thermodesulfovibrionales bacterium]
MNLAIPKGFLFSTTEASIKKPGRPDLALIYSDTACVISGMFTTNRIKAAPVKHNIKKIKKGLAQAIVVNSGNANACTGKQGLKDVAEIVKMVGNLLKLDPELIYVCSTGVIGIPLPMDRIRQRIPILVKDLGSSTIEDVAKAIMTTDTFPKIVTKQIRISEKAIKIAGICKGAGMIHPKMATMLCFIMTDADIEKVALDTSLRTAVAQSFNRITVDGDMSTNDTVLAMANGRSESSKIELFSEDFRVFTSALREVTYELSKLIIEDGEGAKKLIKVEVLNASTERDAEKIAFSIANSMLVKTALYGNDANWGRIMAAIGYSGGKIREHKIDIYLNGLKIVEKGIGTGRDLEANEALKNREIFLKVDLNIGSASTKVLTCDLSEDYIKINAEYRS